MIVDDMPVTLTEAVHTAILHLQKLTSSKMHDTIYKQFDETEPFQKF